MAPGALGLALGRPRALGLAPGTLGLALATLGLALGALGLALSVLGLALCMLGPALGALHALGLSLTECTGVGTGRTRVYLLSWRTYRQDMVCIRFVPRW